MKKVKNIKMTSIDLRELSDEIDRLTDGRRKGWTIKMIDRGEQFELVLVVEEGDGRQ